MAEIPVRVGLIGAGGNVRNRHIPGFQGAEDCEIVAVANRSIESGRAVADQFNIPRVYGNWRELLEDEEINAVCIGTWPYMHRAMTLAALEAGKHVLTEARMASTAEEARDMLQASLAHPDLVCQLTPTSTSYTIDNVLKRLIGEGFLGELLSVDFTSLQNNFADPDGPLHWRHDRALSGYNTLNIGASYESMMRWLGRGTRVMAMSKIHVPYRRDDAVVGLGLQSGPPESDASNFMPLFSFPSNGLSLESYAEEAAEHTYSLSPATVELAQGLRPANEKTVSIRYLENETNSEVWQVWLLSPDSETLLALAFSVHSGQFEVLEPLLREIVQRLTWTER